MVREVFDNLRMNQKLSGERIKNIPSFEHLGVAEWTEVMA